MLKELFSLISEGYGLFTAVLGSDASEDVSDEIKKFIALVSEQKYAEAGNYLIECIKTPVELGIDDIVLQASRVNLDLKDMTNVKLTLADAASALSETGEKPDPVYKKAINIIDNVLTYTR